MTKVPIPYHSAHSHLETKAQVVAEGAREAGARYQGRKIGETAIKLRG